MCLYPYEPLTLWPVWTVYRPQSLSPVSEPPGSKTTCHKGRENLERLRNTHIYRGYSCKMFFFQELFSFFKIACNLVDKNNTNLQSSNHVLCPTATTCRRSDWPEELRHAWKPNYQHKVLCISKANWFLRLYTHTHTHIHSSVVGEERCVYGWLKVIRVNSRERALVQYVRSNCMLRKQSSSCLLGWH